MEFNDFEWHDSILKRIEIDRSEFREIDTIYFDIEWPDNTSSKVIFEDVYQAKFIMNFGIMGTEQILAAFISEDDSDLINLYKVWKGLINDIELKCYVIKTASTGSEIKIIAKSYKLD